MHLIQIPKEVFTREELDDEIRWFAYQKKCFRLWKFDDFYTAPTFYYHNGLKNISNKFLNYIKGKDFLDLGAYAGDSVLVFQEYGPRKVIAFDVSRLNAEKFWKTMFQNKIPKERVELIIAGVSDSCGKLKINDSGLDDTSLLLHGETEVDTITIDNFIKQRKQSLNAGFNKMDTEGFGLQAIHGMVETIKQYRPVLALAVYHNPSEFFRIKPFIASLDINYRFAIRKFSHAALTGETYLMAWPVELGDYGESFSNTGV
jgi:FkbM family methyltransferase